MNNVVNFLLDYYVWVLVVLVVIIITIIGFLVDSKQKRKKVVENSSNNNNEEVKTVESLPVVNGQKDTPVMDSINNMIPNNNGMVNENVALQNINSSILETQNNMNKVELQSNGVSDLTFQNMAINSINPINNNEKIIVPQPISAVSINKPVEPIVNRVETPQVPNISVNANYTNSMVEVQKPEPVSMNFNNQNIAPTEPVQNMGVTPNYSNLMTNVVKPDFNGQPINNPIPQRGAEPVQNMGVTPNYSNPMTNVVKPDFNGQPINNPIPQRVAEPVQNANPTVNQYGQNQLNTTAIPNIGINFVTGENSQPDNSNDNWNL